jgi:hypothetical protein
MATGKTTIYLRIVENAEPPKAVVAPVLPPNALDAPVAAPAHAKEEQHYVQSLQTILLPRRTP